MLPNLRLSTARYTLLGDDNDSGEKTISGSIRARGSQFFTHLIKCWRELAIIGLCVVCAFLTFEHSLRPFGGGPRAHVQGYRLTSNVEHWRQFHWVSDVFSSKDPGAQDAVNAAWDRIVPAFGFVAVNHTWAAEHNLPASMDLPSDDSKGVYIIDAYHQLHCLTIIRKTLTEIVLGKTPRVPIQHSMHCFDSLLQYVMCGDSGDTLLYTWGRNETGDGQLRKCVDWNSRKKWARENTACYADGDHPIPLFDHFNHCEINDDGISGVW
ncbi:Cyclochlorotine biosynthesis protein R [Paramyrothecium foliicola]|nr:Cyclochlorotine biosynthesis protein R [Paramyrothecium foliicola]